ncbi:MAG: cytochrome c-type biogenesis protein CcmH [Terriglobales bacterium]
MRTRLMQLRSWKLGMQAGFVLVVAVLLLGATTSDSRARFSDLGRKMMCTCGCGQVLLECNHVGCQSSDKMRAELAALTSGGDPDGSGNAGGGATRSDADILNWFVQKYGTVVLAAPTKTGFNRVAWIMPYAALIVGLVLTAVIVRAWRSRSKAAPAASAAAANAAQLDTLRRRVHEETEI